MKYETEIWAVDPQYPDLALLARAAVRLCAGELVAFPTETVYGLGANALDAGAVARIFAAKERPAADPLIVHIADMSGLAEVAADWPALVAPLAAAFWPGPLTLVLPRGPAVPLAVTAGGDTVAVRMPAHPIAHGLIRAAGVPVAAPSANRFTRPSPTRAADVAADLAGRLPLILDGGPTLHGVESTVLDLTSDLPRLLRPGAIPLEQLRRLLPDLAAASAPGAINAAVLRSPGTMLKHYAPQAELWLFDGPDPARVLAALAAAVTQVRAAGGRAGLLLTREAAGALGPALPGPDLVWADLGAAADLPDQAHRLFAALRDLDSAGVTHIFAQAPAAHGLALTLRDRLIRAASGRVRYVEV